MTCLEYLPTRAAHLKYQLVANLDELLHLVPQADARRLYVAELDIRKACRTLDLCVGIALPIGAEFPQLREVA